MTDSTPPPPPPPSWTGSTPPPPPAPSHFGSHPPPPPTAHFGSPAHSSGVVPGTAPDTAGLRKAAIVLFWCTTGATVLLAIALVRRRMVWADFEDDPTFEAISDLDDADNLVGGAVFLVFALALATVIVVSIWSLRVARHAERSGATGVSPGLACGGWYIPLANLIIPYMQLRNATRHFGRPTQYLNLWQGMAIATFVFALILQGIDPGGADSFGEVSGQLTTQIVVGGLLAVAAAVTAFLATTAMRQIEGV